MMAQAWPGYVSQLSFSRSKNIVEAMLVVEAML